MSVITRNENATNLIAFANKMANTNTKGAWGSYDKTSLCTIAHISDLHNDTTRYRNFLTYVNSLGSLVDHIFETGDLVDTPTDAQYSAAYAIEDEISIFPNKVVGNHEKYAGGTYMSNADIYTNLHMETNTGELYYYVDDATYNIRFIVLNLYDIDAQVYKLGHLSQAQIDWFITALQGAITNGYDVIIAMHGCESGGNNGTFPQMKSADTAVALYDYVGNPIGADANPFYQRFKQWEGMADLKNQCSGTPIEDIVNAFKTGGTINKTYSFLDVSGTITANATFSTKGTFIAYMVGHVHGDFIGCSSVYHNQLYLAVGAGNPVYGNVSDLQRISGEFSEDAFNVYVIDQTHKLIKVIRVGACVNDLMENRISAVFSYDS